MLRNQKGSSLLEGLISIAIFSFGVLGTMSFQANMLAMSTQTSYRLAASMYVNSLSGAAEADPANYSCYTYPTVNSASNCTAASAYMVLWAANAVALKGSSSSPPTAIYDATTGNLTISVYWKLPQEKSDVAPHTVTAIIQPLVGV